MARSKKIKMSRQHKVKAQGFDALMIKLFTRKSKRKVHVQTGTVIKCIDCGATHNTLYRLNQNMYMCVFCKKKREDKIKKENK